VLYDSLQQEIRSAENYLKIVSNCLTDTYVHVYKKDKQATSDTIEVSKYTYKDNGKDVFIRTIYGALDCYYDLSDSIQFIKNDDGRLVSEKKWRGKTHEFNDYTYLKNGKLDLVYTDFAGSKSNWKQIRFHHYDTFDSLVLIEDYALKNDKIDSTDVNTRREIIYERDNKDRFSKITDFNNLCGSSSITYFQYDCDSRIKEKMVSDFSKTTLMKLEYFDDPCDTLPIAKNTISVYPNPAQDVLNVEANENQHLKKIDISDLQGQLIQSFDANACNTYIALNISDLWKGIYVVKVVFDNGETTSKRFVKH
jgi:hypothetical protein